MSAAYVAFEPCAPYVPGDPLPINVQSFVDAFNEHRGIWSSVALYWPGMTAARWPA